MSERPNVLLILTDQQHWQALSALGNPNLRTPNMDRLVRAGSFFERCYCPAPVCGPSRMSLATGLPPHEHGFTHHFSEEWDWEKNGLVSFGHSLRAGGYETYWTGKWHAAECFPKYEQSTPGFTNLNLGHDDSAFRIEQGWDMDGRWAGRAVEFLRNRPDTTPPFFLGVSLLNPHDICYWLMDLNAEKIKSGLAAMEGPPPALPENFEIDPNEMEIVRHRRSVLKYGPELQWTLAWGKEEWRAYLRVYYRLVERVDAEIGKVLDALEASGLAGETLVIFTSDHGEGCAAHRLVVKLSPYEEALRVPLVMAYPGKIPAGRTISSQVANGLDLGATILDFAGVKALRPSRGISLKNVLLGKKDQLRDFTVSELHPDKNEPAREARIVCTTRAKYIFATDGRGGTEEGFYDLAADPGEQHNVAREPERAAEVREMRQRLHAWMKDCNDPLAALLGPWDIGNVG